MPNKSEEYMDSRGAYIRKRQLEIKGFTVKATKTRHGSTKLSWGSDKSLDAAIGGTKRTKRDKRLDSAIGGRRT